MQSRDAGLMSLLIAWARSKGIPRPQTPEGMRALTQRFLAELSQRAGQQYIAVKQFGDDPAIIAASGPQLHINRTDGNMIDAVDVETDHDDFAQLQQDRAESLAEADGDDLAAAVLYRDRVEARRNAQAPIASTAPSSHVKTHFGNVLSVQPATSTALMGPFQQVASWPGDDDECRAVSIDIAPVPTQVSGAGNLRVPGGAVSRPVALVEWGTSQGLYHALVDLGSGMHLVIACSSVNVSIALDAGSTASMQVYGSLSFGSSPHPTAATRTAYADSLGPSGTAVTYRPPFATTIVAVERSDFTVAVGLVYKDLAGNTIGLRTFATSTAIDAPLYLPNDCVEVDLLNIDLSKTVNARLVYGLTL
jgi:hypothetical protein